MSLISRDVYPSIGRRGPLGYGVGTLNPFDAWFSALSPAFGGISPLTAAPLDLMPRCDAWEDANGFHVECEVPGYDKKDVNVEIFNGALVINGSYRSQAERPSRNFILSERREGTFNRTIGLPLDVDMQKPVSARFENGILKVDLPKVAGATMPRRIQIA